MIIFDLDGTLADCEHRKHFIDLDKMYPSEMGLEYADGRKWQPDWQAFYEACDKDKPIHPVIKVHIEFRCGLGRDCFQIWSTRCESIRDKTEKWLIDYNIYFDKLKMRPIGDSTPDYKLKEQWYDLHNVENPRKNIEMVFDSDPKSIEMWRRRGVFVFDCNQTRKEF